ncbi:MAG: hypothetical protein MSC31_11095 [Solirubrobacteraceae bacterium MAG38_C4-C5]|nr:hypothetical protein [Candidatus Siliceabacter maunaloa]
MSWTVELDTAPGRGQDEEAMTVTWDDGRTERMRLHEYERVYAIPGLYEEVVQNRLDCLGPAVLADALVDAAGSDAPRVFDLGAGNGVVGSELHERGVEVLVGSDNIAAARDAAHRDRPGLYAEYLVGEVEALDPVALVGRHRLDALVCAGALGLGHITADAFGALWAPFPAGAVFAASVREDLARPGGSDFGDWLADPPAGTEIVRSERFRHRLTMAGDELHYMAVVARKA